MPNLSQELLQTLDEVLQQSLSLPLLSHAELPQFRHQLTAGSEQYPSALNAVFLGAQAATPGMAFLSGYQNAIRCLDPKCPADVLAAFCVSEKGIKKPWDMHTRITPSCLNSVPKSYQLSGQKGYVMLLPNDLDRLYVIAKDETEQLRCVFISSQVDGLGITESLKTPFVQDIPHSGVVFDEIDIPVAQLMDLDGHQQANKPFRYWEDVHVTLAMMAWVLRGVENTTEASSVLAKELIKYMGKLIELYNQYPEYYSKESFAAFDACQSVLEEAAESLPGSLKLQWQQDRPLLQMGYKIRQMIQAKMAK